MSQDAEHKTDRELLETIYDCVLELKQARVVEDVAELKTRLSAVEGILARGSSIPPQ